MFGLVLEVGPERPYELMQLQLLTLRAAHFLEMPPNALQSIVADWSIHPHITEMESSFAASPELLIPTTGHALVLLVQVIDELFLNQLDQRLQRTVTAPHQQVEKTVEYFSGLKSCLRSC